MNLEERTIGYILTGPYDPSSPPPILDRLGKFLETPQDVNIYKGATPNDLLHPPSNNPVEALIKNNPFLSTKAFNAAYRLLRNAIDQRHYNVVLALEPVIAAPQYANLLGKDATPSLLDFEFYLLSCRSLWNKRKNSSSNNSLFKRACPYPGISTSYRFH